MDKKTAIEQSERNRSRSQSPHTEVPTAGTEPENGEDPEVHSAESHAVSFLGLRAKKPSVKGIVLKVFFRWFITLLLAVAITGVIVYYSRQPVLSRDMKRHFNAIITGLSIALGLALVTSLDGMVSELRWWVLSRRYRSRRKVELILRADSMVHLIMLAAKSSRYSIHAAVGSWVVIIFISQIGVAAIGLCYSLDTAWKATLRYSGNISIPDMSEIETARVITSKSTSLGGQQFTANSYGTVSLAFTQVDLSQVPENGTMWFPGDPMIFCNVSLCRYYFHETSTRSIIEDALNPITISTLRYVEASTSCRSWPVVSGGNGSTSSITVALADGDADVTLPLPIGIDITAFMTNITENCGFGCSQLSAFEASATAPWFYECNSSISQVVGAVIPEHKVSGELATMASRAIALQGDETSSLVNDIRFQYQLYPAESVFGTPVNGTPEYLALIISRFAAGVVAATAEYNDAFNVTGRAPDVGEALNVKHPRIVTVILVLIVTIQLILDIAFAWVANRVVVPRRDVLSIAEVLRPMTVQKYAGSKVKPHSRASNKQKQDTLWIYSCQRLTDDEYDLCMIEHKDSPLDGTENHHDAAQHARTAEGGTEEVKTAQ